ncbi:MAG: winged helix-turn-helix domain-containing protein [Actinomycetota bacterium]|nr:winged helix-turn-helix domain-containing protein [Actinomycetota bacterium]
MELSVGPMSPSQFVEKVGGDLSYVSRCFRQLADWGFAEVIEERPGRRRGASVEHVYRGIQRAHFDTSTWKSVALSEREALSRSVLESYFSLVAEAIEAGTFDDELDRHLSWDSVALDRIAWLQLVTRLDRALEWLPDLEINSVKRINELDGEAIPTTVGLAAFRSPQPAEIMLKAPRRDQQATREAATEEAPITLTPKMVKALSNRWRSQILMELNARPMSPSQFVEEVGGSMTHISRCFRQLAQWGFIEVIEERRGGRHRGGVERVYRNTRRAYFDTPAWQALPRFLRNEVSKSFLASYLERITEAINAGTFDAELDRHLSWRTVVLDRVAWGQISTALDALLEWLPVLERESIKRTEGEISKLIPTTIGLSSFRSPQRSH